MRSQDAGAVCGKIMLAELTTETVRISAAGGMLAGKLTYPFDDTSFASLIVNPHPHMGGRTGNRVLVRLAEVLAGQGGVVLSFDYSGVGESDGSRIDIAESMSRFWQTGSAPEDPRMIDDTRQATAWITEATKLPLMLVGYSFGAYAATLALTDNVGALVLISPTVKQHDFLALQRRMIAKLIVYSDNDFATSQSDMEIWTKDLPQPLETCCLPGGDHFFRGQEDAVANACRDFACTFVAMETH